MPVAFQGDPLEIGFNPEFLRAGLEAIEQGDVLLKLISPLRPGMIEAAENVCGGDGINESDVLDLLSRLLSKSLVFVDCDLGERRYRFLETVRQYARERLLQAEREARLRAEDLQRFFSFLAEAGRELVSSLDYEETLARVATLAVPHIADWCGIHVVQEDGTVAQLAVAHVDPAKVSLARELERRYPFDPEGPTGAPNVIRTGKSELIEEVPDEPEFPDAETPAATEDEDEEIVPEDREEEAAEDEEEEEY